MEAALRHARKIVVLLAAATHLLGCASAGVTRPLRGQSGSVSWEISDVRQEPEEPPFQMRWTFWIAVKNLGDTGIAFEELEIGSQPGGTVDHFWGGIGTEPFTRRLEPGAELRLRRSHASSCPLCGPAELHRAFADGVIVYFTLTGRDDRGGGVRVPIAIRLDRSVGDRQ